MVVRFMKADTICMYLHMVVHEYTTRKMNKKVVSSNGKNLVTKRSQSKEQHYPSVCVSVEPSVGALPHMTRHNVLAMTFGRLIKHD